MTSLTVPLLFNDVPAAAARATNLELRYQLAPYKPNSSHKLQPILAGRSVLTPELRLNDYSCKAVIDWVELSFPTTGSHQAVNIYRTATRILSRRESHSTVFVSGPTREPGYIGSEFILRIQQPQNHELLELLQDIVKTYPTTATSLRNLQLAGIEVSIDFYPDKKVAPDQGTRDLLRSQMTDTLRRHLRPPSILTEEYRCQPRFYNTPPRRDKSTSFVSSRVNISSGKSLLEINRLGLRIDNLTALNIGAHNRCPVDTTCYIGAKEFPVMLRVMDKRTDRRDPDKDNADDLPHEEWRSRVEACLQNKEGWSGIFDELELNFLSDLFGFKFKTLRKPLFEFYLPTFSEDCPAKHLPFRVTANEQSVFERSGAYGLDRFHRAVTAVETAQYKLGERSAKPISLGSKGRLVSYADMNRKINSALDGLTKSWQDELTVAARSVRKLRRS